MEVLLQARECCAGREAYGLSSSDPSIIISESIASLPYLGEPEDHSFSYDAYVDRSAKFDDHSYMASAVDDVTLPFSTLDSIVGDVFSVHWEPEMMNELGNALKILTSEVLSSVGTSVLGTTMMMGGLMSGLSLPIGMCRRS